MDGPRELYLDASHSQQGVEMTDTRDLLAPWRRLYEQKRHKRSPEDGMECGNGGGVWAERKGQKIKKGDAARGDHLEDGKLCSWVMALRGKIYENWNPIDEFLLVTQ